MRKQRNAHEIVQVRVVEGIFYLLFIICIQGLGIKKKQKKKFRLILFFLWDMETRGEKGENNGGHGGGLKEKR